MRHIHASQAIVSGDLDRHRASKARTPIGLALPKDLHSQLLSRRNDAGFMTQQGWELSTLVHENTVFVKHRVCETPCL